MWGLTREAVGENEAVENWWLPNDEGNLPMLKEIRKVVTERHANDATPTPGNESIADVRDLKAFFEKLELRTQSAGQAAATDDDFSPMSADASGGTSDRGSNASFSPTNTGVSDVSKTTTSSEGSTLRRRGKRSGSKP